MIFYKPVTDAEKIKEIFPQFVIDENNINGAYVGYDDNNSECGKCLLEIDGYAVTIRALTQPDNDAEIIEGLLRAALNFAGNRNAFLAYCRIDEISSVLETLGFKKENEVYKGEIPFLLMGSCCKDKGEN